MFLSNEEIERLEASGIDTYAKFAFCCNYQPGSQDDGPLFNFLEATLGTRPEGASAASFRRLFFESHALCLQDLKSRLERNDNTDAKILPLAEKAERVAMLKNKLTGLEITTELEPSHQLTRQCNSMRRTLFGIWISLPAHPGSRRSYRIRAPQV